MDVIKLYKLVEGLMKSSLRLEFITDFLFAFLFSVIIILLIISITFIKELGLGRDDFRIKRR